MEFLSKKPLSNPLLGIISILLIILGISNCSLSTINQNSERALDRGVSFLNSSYSKEYLFNDPYIKCVEQLAGCNPEYRKIDIATILVFFLSKAIKEDPRMKQVVSDAEKIMFDHLESWKNETLMNVPLDLYAIFPYYYPDQAGYMIDQIVEWLRDDGSWYDYDFYETGFEWRVITDESWPIVALAKNKEDKNLIIKALKNKKKQGESIMNGSLKLTSTGAYYAMAHIYHAFTWTKKEGYDLAEYDAFVNKVADWLVLQTLSPSLSNWTTSYGETLYWLSEGDYGNKSVLDNLAKELLKRQENDGSWRFSKIEIGQRTPSGLLITKENFDTAKSHSTLVAILGLEAYKTNVLKK